MPQFFPRCSRCGLPFPEPVSVAAHEPLCDGQRSFPLSRQVVEGLYFRLGARVAHYDHVLARRIAPVDDGLEATLALAVEALGILAKLHYGKGRRCELRMTPRQLLIAAPGVRFAELPAQVRVVTYRERAQIERVIVGEWRTVSEGTYRDGRFFAGFGAGLRETQRVELECLLKSAPASGRHGRLYAA